VCSAPADAEEASATGLLGDIKCSSCVRMPSGVGKVARLTGLHSTTDSIGGLDCVRAVECNASAGSVAVRCSAE
jgi:hypothetical protein